MTLLFDLLGKNVRKKVRNDSMTIAPIHRKIWGRQKSRPFSAAQHHRLETLLPQVQIHVDPPQPLLLQDHFPKEISRYHLEIGFGNGEHLLARARSCSSDVGMIGCDPFLTGAIDVLRSREKECIRLVIDDARLLLKALPDQTLERIYILFPDPWHKTRHHKRRIISKETVQDFKRVLLPKGQVLIATDIKAYASWIQEAFASCSEFSRESYTYDPLTQRPMDWPAPTKYEQKGRQAGREIFFFLYQRSLVTR